MVATRQALPQRAGERGIVCIEPGVGGRLFESFETDAGERVVPMGQVRVWEPPQRLVFEWRAINFAPHEHTEVEVRFEPTSRGTLVTVVHRGWSALRADHPVRPRSGCAGVHPHDGDVVGRPDDRAAPAHHGAGSALTTGDAPGRGAMARAHSRASEHRT